MASLQNLPTVHRTLFHNSFPQLQKHGAFRSYRREGVSIVVNAAQLPLSSSAGSLSQVGLLHCLSTGTICIDYSFDLCETSTDRPGRRQVIALGATAALFFLSYQHSYSFAAENQKGFLSVMDKKDGYSFLYPFGWQEVVIEGQDKVFKDVIEPLESVSVNMIPTGKHDIREFGPPQQVAETLIKKVLAPPTQKTKLIEVKEQDIDGKAYYQFEFIAQASNYTRHALSTVSVGNGKFYTLTTGANERRWEKMKDRLQTVVKSFKIVNV